MSTPIPLNEAIRIKLEERAGPVHFSDLRAHLSRDAVFVVNRAVSLLDCGVFVATDDVDQVIALIEAGNLRKPSRKEREEWPSITHAAWQAVVVQPYVLVQWCEEATQS